ncbi:MAG TPA: VOC family protein [Acidimicrobiales bacterium]|nr:VOC family protein [Acidimicrobiales bacterium]
MNTHDRAGSDASTVLQSIGAVFDHAAHAVPSVRSALPLYRDLLGGTVVVGGINPWGGHLAIQLEYAHGGRIELLEPVERDSTSVGRFLERSPRGGLHHLTFKVDDLAAALDPVTSAGFTPFGTMLDQPNWKETYLHPGETGGVLIQLAQARPGFPRLEQPLEDLLDQADAMRRAAGI